MKKTLPLSIHVVAVALGLMCLASVAHAQARHDVRREHFSTPHWRYDNRFHHDHYYPQLGYPVRALPSSRIAITFRGSPFFFHAGVWYRPSGATFIVVRPPIGIVVPVLPPSYATIWVGTEPYYYADDVFYQQTNEGYAVVAPPSGYVEQDAPPPQAVAPAAPQAGSGTWYYCESSKTYYPYVSECKEGWKEVPATPPHG
ncbi:MAG TPA: DUF6515 family protein [Burkholderiales bacterium]|nr:DUF6515 family protein [Burkholderiales bacterium]